VKRLLLAATVLAGALTAASARADDAQFTCDRTPVPPGPSSESPLFPPRAWELWPTLGFLTDWAAGPLSPDVSFGIELAKPFDVDQRWRLGIHAGYLLGHWGGDRASSSALDASLNLRWSPLMTDFFDGYFIVKPAGADIALSDSRVALRWGAGIGMRALRAIEIEATADALVALKDTFPNGDRAGLGVTFSLGYDLCLEPFGCTQAQPSGPVTKALTCELYDQADATCGSLQANPGARTALCQAVYTSMDASADPGSRPLDATHAFLLALAASLADPGLKKAVEDLATTHKRLYEQIYAAKGERYDERMAAQSGEWLHDHCTYEPNAIELRGAFGCDTDGKPLPSCSVPPECVAPR
jgi:hypothetical protein